MNNKDLTDLKHTIDELIYHYKNYYNELHTFPGFVKSFTTEHMIYNHIDNKYLIIILHKNPKLMEYFI